MTDTSLRSGSAVIGSFKSKHFYGMISFRRISTGKFVGLFYLEVDVVMHVIASILCRAF
jgi:hypothetical protein